MVKHSVISVIFKMKRKDLLNFKYSISPIRYGDLLHILNCTKRLFISERFVENFGKTSTTASLFGKNKIEYVIKN